MRAKRAKPERVYPAESDPRQVTTYRSEWLSFKNKPRRVMTVGGTRVVRWDLAPADTTEHLAREFGPWVRGADGRWERDRRKR